jgi:hypothetical protein
LIRARQRLGIRYREYARALWPAVSSTIVMAAAAMAMARTARDWSLAARTASEVAVAAAVYSAALLTLHRERIDAWRLEWRRR